MPKYEVTRKQSVIVEVEVSDSAVRKAFRDIDQDRWNPDGPLADLESVGGVEE